MKTSKIVSMVALLVSSTGFANEPFLDCKVEEFGNLKAIELYDSTKKGVAVELVETVLDQAGDNDLLVRMPPASFAIKYDDFYVLNTCWQYSECNLQKGHYGSPNQWIIHACNDMAHNMDCNDLQRLPCNLCRKKIGRSPEEIFTKNHRTLAMSGKEPKFLRLSRGGEGESCPSLRLEEISTNVQIQQTYNTAIISNPDATVCSIK